LLAPANRIRRNAPRPLRHGDMISGQRWCCRRTIGARSGGRGISRPRDAAKPRWRGGPTITNYRRL